MSHLDKSAISIEVKKIKGSIINVGVSSRKKIEHKRKPTE